MLERDARAKKDTWRNDIQAIKGLGFNTVRAWIDWASASRPSAPTLSTPSTCCWSWPKRRA